MVYYVLRESKFYIQIGSHDPRTFLGLWNRHTLKTGLEEAGKTSKNWN